eukprot:jgi/Tetstr1/421205/TSEL_001110.t1
MAVSAVLKTTATGARLPRSVSRLRLPRLIQCAAAGARGALRGSGAPCGPPGAGGGWRRVGAAWRATRGGSAGGAGGRGLGPACRALGKGAGGSFHWASAVSKAAVLKLAIQQAADGCLEQLPPGAEPTFGLVFVSSRFSTEFSSVLPTLKALVPSLQHVVGSSGFGVIGGSLTGETTSVGGVAAPEEVELVPGLSLTLGVLPGVRVRTFALTEDTLPDADAPPDRWAEALGDALAGLDFAYPTSTKVGGLSSSTSMREQWAAFVADEAELEGGGTGGVKYGGMVGVAMSGAGFAIDSIVAQGCRQVGEHTYTVVRSKGQLVLEVEDEAGAGSSPLQALQETVAALSPEEQQLVQRSITAALARESLKPLEELQAGDFLVRGLQGADLESGALAMGDDVKVGDRLRFMVRDQQGAVQDLAQQMADYKRAELAKSFAGSGTDAPFGAVLFACNGRGEGLFSESNHDSATFASYIPVPVSGFFCNGEIGPVGASTYLHGFTAVFAVLRAAPRGEGEEGQR